MKLNLYALLIAGGVAAGVAGCGATPDTAKGRSDLAIESNAAVERFKADDPSLKKLLERAVGYAVIPEAGKGGLIVGGAFGNGEVYEGGKKIGYCEIVQGTIGFQLGGQVFSELIVFKDKASMAEFKAGQFSFAANATAVAVKPGAAASVDSMSGVSTFIAIKGGLMAEAAIGGQKLNYKPL